LGKDKKVCKVGEEGTRKRGNFVNGVFVKRKKKKRKKGGYQRVFEKGGKQSRWERKN